MSDQKLCARCGGVIVPVMWESILNDRDLITAELLAAVQRARRHAENIGITDGSYVAQLDAAIAAATQEKAGA